MSKFLMEFVCRSDRNRFFQPRVVEIPLDKDGLDLTLMDVEDEIRGDTDLVVETTRITALEDVEDPSIYPSATPIREGDVVWRNWDVMDWSNLSRKDGFKMLEGYKPLWEEGPGHEMIPEIVHLL